MKVMRTEIIGALIGAGLALALVTAASAQVSVQSNSREHRKYSFALRRTDGTNDVFGTWNSTFSGKPAEEQLLVVKAGKTFKITDRATIKQAEEILAPVNKLSHEQEILGNRQEKLGDEQEKLGDKQEAIGDQLSKLGEAMPETDDASRKGLEAKMSAMSSKMEELGKQQHDLGRRQEALGRQQDELGRKEEAAFKTAEPKLNRLFDAAFAKGLAKPL